MKMKVLWICNTLMPMIAEQMNIEGSNKEGWISGLAYEVLTRQKENGIRLAIAFPAPKGSLKDGQEILRKTVKVGDASCECFGFYEEKGEEEYGSPDLGNRLVKIYGEVKPEVVHCFGTEYPHAGAAVRFLPDKKRLLFGLQGLCACIAEAYCANLPDKVINAKTLRDRLRWDNIIAQRRVFQVRGAMEQEIIGKAENITGRTEWDREYTEKWNKNAVYYKMNETLRPEFYGPVWERDKCIPHSIFVSQGDYPLKGLHYMLLALPDILAEYPDATLYVAGNSLIKYDTLKDRLKISAYGKYLRKLIKENRLKDKVISLGPLNARQMRDRYLQSSLFVCCSAVENSPNSLGEAMLLGMPCVSAGVGGVFSVFTGGRDGILYEGYRMPDKNIKRDGITGDSISNQNNNCYSDGQQLKDISRRLASAVLEMWRKPEKMEEYCKNARNHAAETHDKEKNYQRLLEIYAEIVSRNEEKKE